MSVLLQYKGVDVPVFTVEPDWSSGLNLKMLDKVLVREALDTSEERLQTRPRPLYGLSYTPLTMTEQETGYMRRLLELADGLPFALPMWQDKVALTANVSAGGSSLTVESTANSLWDTFNSLAIIWRAFDDWELVSVDTVSATSIALDAEIQNSWTTTDSEGKTAWVIPLAFGKLSRNDVTNITSDHAKISVEFEERHFPVTVTASPSSGSSSCCQTTGAYYKPAYSQTTDRVGVGNSASNPSNYQARLIAPECTGAALFSSTHITGGATWVPTVGLDRIYAGKLATGGGDELCVVIDVPTATVSYIGGFPNPTGNAYGLRAEWISAAGPKIWMQVKNCGGDYAFAVIDPSDNSVEMISDPILATCLADKWAYCTTDGQIYCACAGGVLARIEVITHTVTTVDLSAFGAISELLAITYVGAFGAVDGSDKVWLSYRAGSAYGIGLIDPSDFDNVAGSFPTSTGFNILWYAGAYEFVLGADGTDTLTVFSTDTTVSPQEIDGYRMTDLGTYVDSNAKIVVPTYTGGEYCLTYFSPTLSGLSSDGPFAMATELGSIMTAEPGDLMATES